MHLPGRPVAAFDPEGLIFAAGIGSEMIKLYDMRSFDKVCGHIFGCIILIIYWSIDCQVMLFLFVYK